MDGLVIAVGLLGLALIFAIPIVLAWWESGKYRTALNVNMNPPPVESDRGWDYVGPMPEPATFTVTHVDPMEREQ